LPKDNLPMSTGKPAPWTFRNCFRRGAFGWRGSKPAIARIDEALAEIRAAARSDPVRGAEGAVLFLEKLSPALSDVDSSSGALGNATAAAVATLAPLTGAAPVADSVRDKWLERLYAALEDDDPPYIESLGDHWGPLCATPALASHWADTLLPGLQAVAKVRGTGQFAWFRGTVACYSALYAAGRHQEVLDLLTRDLWPIWPCLVFGARVHAARGTVDDAIGWLQERAGATVPAYALASVAEELLLAAGRRTEAYARFGIAANPANTHLATYRALAKKYPEIPAERLLADLIASTPGEEGKWFATAKTLRRLDLAIALAQRSPCDPKTLIRAARDHIDGEPHFALEAAIAALRWMAQGYGYELTGLDVLAAYRHAHEAGERIGVSDDVARRLEMVLADAGPRAHWMRQSLPLPGR
jgi:hypothetical protein